MNLKSQNSLLQGKELLKQVILESNIYHDDDFRSGSLDDHLSALDELITFCSQNFDRVKTLMLILAKDHALVMLRLCTSDGL